MQVLSINIISASPTDASLTRALASGAVASAEALMAETTARGNARAATIVVESEAECTKLGATGKAEADIILVSRIRTLVLPILSAITTNPVQRSGRCLRRSRNQTCGGCQGGCRSPLEEQGCRGAHEDGAVGEHAEGG